MVEGSDFMYKEIPFYDRKDAIKTIKEIGDNYYELSIYDKNGNTKNKKVIIAKQDMQKNYLNAIDSYLYHMKDKYEEASNIINNKTIKNNCLKMLLISIIVGLGLPTIGYLMNSAILYYLGFTITGIACVPTFIYSLKELVFKTSESEIKKSIEVYENLIKERNKVKNDIDKYYLENNPTVFRHIEPMKQENKKDNKNKKLIREKE